MHSASRTTSRTTSSPTDRAAHPATSRGARARRALSAALPLPLLTAALAAVLAVTALVAAPTSASGGHDGASRVVPLNADPVSFSVSTNTYATRAYESRILTLVNAQRARYGLRPLALASCPDGFATRWSVHLAYAGALSHQSLWTILRSCPATAAGENVGWTTSSADAMVRMWMNSPGHRANILSSRYHRIGIGVARTSTGRWYATQDFLS